MYGHAKNDIIFIKLVFFLSLCKLFRYYCIQSIFIFLLLSKKKTAIDIFLLAQQIKENEGNALEIQFLLTIFVS